MRTLAALSLLLAACASTPVVKQTDDLQERERQLTRALVRYDRNALNQLLADDFTCEAITDDNKTIGFNTVNGRFSLCTAIGLPGPTIDHPEWMEDLDNSRGRRNAEVTAIDVQQQGDTATVQSVQIYRRWYPYDGSHERLARVTDTWQRREGSWRLTHRLSQPILDGAQASARR